MKLLNFIICDDVRSELGNKYSLIGVYDDVIEFNVPNIESNSWPKHLKLGLFAKFTTDSEEERKKIFSIKIKTKYNGIEQSLVESILNTNKTILTPKINIAIVFTPFVFDNVGNLDFTFEFNDEAGKLITSVTPANTIKITEKLIT